MTNPKHTSSDLDTQEAIAWANKVIKAKGTAYTPASRNAAAFILASCDRIEALEAEVERWKELLHRSADQIYSLTGDFGSEDNDLADEIRAALEARHD